MPWNQSGQKREILAIISHGLNLGKKTPEIPSSHSRVLTNPPPSLTLGTVTLEERGASRKNGLNLRMQKFLSGIESRAKKWKFLSTSSKPQTGTEHRAIRIDDV
jgi:hypothetical protein